ncbi:Protein CBR-ETR-1 [Caenorhabditis briggsae]|uniref:RRM domain-containing protein n=2 Tax=Caenorhabditis briggsae TaxID=6238 RepID=A0AAE9DP23_CAEBR|nr:Protein CBR-ETR-1 [Caenorhabditis briggsae]ULU09074.1 hypothetical protein L3Y34_019928 [Caenorhabditis briggsae]UMM20962.1 hypothetical protein L5515_016018 [Caenorhabditis briggsae]CAP27367.2 Protein CBR-ETR-1 [Caenorhabditis briggsae]
MSGAVLPAAVHVHPKMDPAVPDIDGKDDVKDVPSTANNDASPSPSEPDSDAIKMFVGQIPRQWNEVDCRRLFEQYGSVYSCNILRDKSTQTSKGCCFVTFFHRKDAIEAQGALHNIKVIDGMHHPVQMKPADTENRNERKLFIGQLSKKHNEENLREIFAKFGLIEDCSVLRDNDGKSRGCAFVTFTNRSCAVVATKEMHHSQTMEGCSAPLVVKFADTQKDKDVKTKSLITGNGAGSPKGGANLLHGLTPALLQQLSGGQNIQAVANLLSFINGPQGQQPQPQQNVLGLLGQVLSTLGKIAEGDDVASKNGSSASTEKRVTSVMTSPHTSGATTAVAPLHLHQQQQKQQQLSQQQQGLGAQLLANPVTAQSQFDAMAMAQAQIAHQNQLLALQGFAVQQSAPSQPQQGYHHHQNQYQYSTGSPDSPSNATDSSDEPTRTSPNHRHQPYLNLPPPPLMGRPMWQQRQIHPQLFHTTYGLAGGLAGAKTTSPVAATLANHQPIALTPFAGGNAALDHFTAMQQQYALLANLHANSGVQTATTSSGQLVGNGDVRGPDGANLFIYHLPQDFGDTDLINTFAPFGQILSAKVFIDKVTNLSKCYGFVSYETPQSANNAIAAMNGFQIGSKRLKVQLKVDRGNPYNR